MSAIIALTGLALPEPFVLAGTTGPQAPPTDSNGVVEVSTPEQLEYIDQNQSNYDSSTIELMNNIDMSELNGGQPYTNWQPIADFTGTFNGQLHTISNMDITQSSINPSAGNSSITDSGFFGLSAGAIKNLILLNVNVNTSATQYVGALVGWNQGTIQDVGSTGSVTDTDCDAAGGLVGYNDYNGTIQYTYSTGNVTSGSNTAVGGLVGSNDNASTSTIFDSYATGNITGGSNTGGLVGQEDEGEEITGTSNVDIYATGRVTGATGADTGGLFGQILSAGEAAYWDTETSGLNTDGSLFAIPETTAQMMDPNTFQWQNPSAWGIANGVSFPYLTPLPAPDINTISVGAGSTLGTTEVTATPNNLGDTFEVAVGSSPSTTANVGVTLPTGSSAVPYTSGTDIQGVDAVTNKYVYVFEVNSSKQIVAYHQFELTGSDINDNAPPISSATIGPGSTDGNTEVTLTPNQMGDSFAYGISNNPAPNPPIGIQLQSNTVTTYTSGSDITDVSPGQYLAIFELNQSNQIEAWREFQLTNSDIKGAPQTITLTTTPNSATVTSGQTVTVTGTVYDGVHNPLPGLQVNLTSSTGSWKNSSVTTDTNGNYTDVWTAPTVSTRTSATLTASVYGTNPTVQGTATITVVPVAPPPPPYVPPVTINTTVMGNGTVGQPYSEQLQASNGNGQYSWSVTQGSLPDGLSLSSNGLISGTPLQSGTSTFTVQVEDASGRTATETYTLNVEKALKVLSEVLLADCVNAPYQQTLTATGGTGGPYTWSIVSGTLPGGLSLDAQTGVISGTPTATGQTTLTVQATDANGGTTTGSITIDVLNHNVRSIVWNGQVKNVPAVVMDGGGSTETTYMPIWYVMQFLKSMGINSTWDGHNWHMTTDNVSPDMRNIQVGSGNAHIYLNGNLVQNVDAVAKTPPGGNQATTFMPIWYVMQLLNRLNLQSTWNGTTWTITNGTPVQPSSK
ncbi:putative Ig domain-containing protein [Alicyclobacillus cycloheptanicus]|uniref:putative Ig domain-containing protein n=1 Tax=Alicyclobacillus cycloheptanicus TaxID=1457 RepID=UPI0023782CF8|nr:putative Ig domain-containing protein [Alicyclobacillus cycloheptanicus]WDM00885.1 putative Ig domain-containing protein [Alicyclobacillus cycloheptanicus]